MAEAVGEVKLEEAILGSGLIESGSHGVALLSGGPDSVGLVSGLVRAVGSDHLTALHVNYGLRSDSDLDQEACQVVCAKLGVELITVRAGERDGNLHDWARGVRYREASLLSERLGLDWIAVGHTRTDLVETVLYRLASSPGTRALRAMPTRRGLLVRPLLSLGRGEVRRAVEETGLPFVDDPSNLFSGFARARIRTGAMPVLGGVNPAFERNVLRTLAELEEEASFLDAEGRALIEEGPNGQPAIDTGVLMQADPAVARHALRLLIGATCGREAPVSIDRTALVRELSRRPEGGSVDFGDGIRIEIGSGLALVEAPSGEASPVAGSRELTIPGAVGWDGWLFGAERLDRASAPRGPDVATLDRSGLGDGVEVRAWRPGDRIRPLGMTGSKPVATLMSERGLPRPRRTGWPVVEASGEIAWVPGIAVSESFRVRKGNGNSVLLTAEPPGPQGSADLGPGT